MMIICMIELLLMAAASVSDIRKKEISMWLILIMAIVSLGGTAWEIYSGRMSIADCAVSLIPAFIMLLISFVSRQGMGYGDGILVLSISMVFGIYRLLVGLSVAFFMTGVLSIVLITIKRAKRNDRLPFIPFILVGMVVSMFA